MSIINNLWSGYTEETVPKWIKESLNNSSNGRLFGWLS